MPSTSASQRDIEARNRRETAWRMAVAADILEAARGDAGAAQAYRAGLVQRVAVQLWGEMQHDTRARLVKLLGWPPLKSLHDSGPGIKAEQHIAALADAELCRYLTACTIVGQTYLASYQTITKPEQLLATAELLGVDVQAAKDRVREVKKATPDKAAAKRAAKKAAQLDTHETALAAALKKEQAAQKLAKPKGAVKYRHPATGDTWSGRGLQPAWLKAALANGRTLSSFLVDQSEPTKTPPKATLSAAAAATGLPTEGEAA